MNDPVISDVHLLRKQHRRSPKTSARRAANPQAKQRKEQAALHRRLQNHDPREPRPELLAAAKHDLPVEVPALTLPPSPAFVLSTVEVFDPGDVRRFAARCLGAEHHPGMPLRSFCPLHPDLNERALTLFEYRASCGAVPLVHCQRCGFALPLLDFAVELGQVPTTTMTLVERTWPEKVRSGEVDRRVVEAVCQQRLRRAILGQGRWLYAAMVVEDGLRPAFGDWAAIPDASLGGLFAGSTMPPEFRQAMYLLHILRNWMGELVAVDVHAQADYRPLFRHWLVIGHDEPLFAAPHWGAFCDPVAKRELVRDAAEGHALELETSRQPVGSRRSIWLRCEPQAVLATYAPFEEMR